jgi:multidrug resistance efflux pump
MTWANRFKFFVGAVVVLGLVAACTLIFNQRQHEATSTSATIAAQVFPVGSDYAGTVIHTYVKAGDPVATGDKLVSVQSAQLATALKQKSITPTSLGYTVTKGGLITFTSAVSGTVASVSALTGAFVTAGTTLVSIDKADSLFVTARYLLTATDYSRLKQGASVDIMLPNQKTISGTVHTISVVTTTTGQAQAQLTVTSSKLVQGGQGGIINPGTPLTARVHLTADGPLAGVEDQAMALVRHVGL